MKLRSILPIICLIIIILIISMLAITSYSYFIFNHNSSNNSSTISIVTINPTVTVDPNSSLAFPPNDIALNKINWSSYTNLKTGYVYLACIAEPTDVVHHKFIEVQICTEVVDTENEATIQEQLAGVAREAKIIYGPNSDINIIGTKGGIARWFASILPYDDKIHY